ncbi:hypothetical protein [Actinoplanes subtropicus]|uniref:hypothetical protein n=1 Tax=Actinoplanes subtropicus TaxID=543632 RepID=UPI0004C37D38|nr:hypothetical protein [Actinoplanes subtropicus]
MATLHLLRDSASMTVRADGAYRLTGDVASGVWWAVGPNRFRIDELARHISDPRPLAADEPLLPPDLLRPH